jgi:hypothetical protein
LQNGCAAGGLQKEKFPAPIGVILCQLLTIKRVAMTPTLAELLAQKQQLVKRLHEEPRLNEQDEIARMLAGVNAMLNQLDGAPIETRAIRP